MLKRRGNSLFCAAGVELIMQSGDGVVLKAYALSPQQIKLNDKYSEKRSFNGGMTHT
jgi:hypothetical protein